MPASPQAPASPGRPSRIAWKSTIINGMVSYLDAGAIVTTGTVLVMYKAQFHLTPAVIGQLSALLTFMIALGSVVGGWLGDRIGRRAVFTTTIMVYALGSLLLVWAPSVEALYAGVVLLGLGVGADLPVSLASIAEQNREGSKAKAVQFSQVIWAVGQLVSMVIAIFVGNMGVVGGRILYLHLLLVAIVVLVLRFQVPESEEWLAQREERLQTQVQAPKPKLAWAELVRTPYFLALLGVSLFYGFVNLAANTFGQFSTYVYTTVAGMSVSDASAIGFVAVAVAIVTSLLFMRVVDTSSKRYFWFAFGGIIKVVGFIVPIVLGGNVGTILVANLASNVSGQLAGEPAFKIWAQELFPARLRALAQGIGICFTRVLAAIVALFTPGLLGLPTGVNGLFGLVALMVLIAIAIGFFWLRRTPTAREREQPSRMVSGGRVHSA